VLEGDRGDGEGAGVIRVVLLLGLAAGLWWSGDPVPASEAMPEELVAWPSKDALLSGRACVPLSVLLENRTQRPIHSYARPIDCK
jgi:hypothetical protein